MLSFLSVLAASPSKVVEDTFYFFEAGLPQGDFVAPEEIECPGGGEEAKGRTDARIRRDKQARGAQLPGETVRVNRACPAKGGDGDDLRVPPFFRDVRFCGPRHGLVNEIMDAPDGLLVGYPEGLGNPLLNPTSGRFPVEPHLSPEEVVLVEIPQKQVGVGNARVDPSPGVAEGSGVRARALRAHLERAHPAYPCDAAATRANLHQVDDRHLDGEPAPFHESLDAAYLEGRHDAGDPLLDQTRFGRRSAHVKAEHFGDIEVFAIVLTCYDRSGRTRLDDPHWKLSGGFDGGYTAAREHDEEFSLEAY